MKDLLNLFKKEKEFSLKAQGTSMMPLLHPGDIVYLKKLPTKKIYEDDIVLIHNKKAQYIHRVVYKKKDKKNTIQYFVTKGDNNFLTDGNVNPKDIYGVVYRIKRKNQLFGINDLYLFQSSLYLNELIKLMKLFEENDINFIILKGLPLHLYYEKQFPRRIYADCDLLINPKDFPKIKRIFKKYKYIQIDTEFSEIHKKLKDRQTEVIMFKKIHNIPISFDIHFVPLFLINQIGNMNAVYPDYLLEKMIKDFFDKKRIVSFEENQYTILSSENLLIYLSLHFFRHNYTEGFRLKLISNIFKKDFQKESDQNKLAILINIYKVNNFVYPVFLLLNKYKYCLVPKEFLKKIEPNIQILKYIQKNVLTVDLFSSEPRVRAGIQRFKHIFFLSPNNFFLKIMIFFKPSILYSLYWVLEKKFKKVIQ